MEYMGQDILLNFGVLVLSTVELKLIIDALQSIDSLSDQSLSVVSRRIYSYTRRSVSYGKKYSEGYPKICYCCTAVPRYQYCVRYYFK